jgi:hypothetical protein
MGSIRLEGIRFVVYTMSQGMFMDSMPKSKSSSICFQTAT